MTGGNALGNLCFLLVAATYCVRDARALRCLALLASVAGIAYNYAVPETPLWLVIYWNAGFLAVNLFQLAALLRRWPARTPAIGSFTASKPDSIKSVRAHSRGPGVRSRQWWR